MAEISLGAGAHRTERRPFFLCMTILLAAIIFGGFGMSYFVPMANGSLADLHALIHIHGFFYFSWMGLLVLQSVLINRGNVALHRSLGLLGIAVAACMVSFGSVVTVRTGAIQVAASDPTAYGIMYISLVALVGFVFLFFLAIRNVRDAAAHRRYVLLATIIFVMAGLNRIFAGLFGIGFEGHLSFLPKYLVVDAMIIALLVYDWRTLGQVHRATAVGAAANLLPQLLHVPIVDSSAFVGLTHWLATLA